MEQLEIVCEHTGRPLGIFMDRSEVIAQQRWCRSTNVFVLSSTGHVLCHQRSLQKERMPGVWCTHLGGHVSRGETFESNAKKELEEEAGIQISAERLLPWRTTRMDVPHLWVREFVTVLEKSADALIAQPDEVECFEWLSPELIQRYADQNPAGWCVGTHDFRIEYQCLQAVVTAFLTRHSSLPALTTVS